MCAILAEIVAKMCTYVDGTLPLTPHLRNTSHDTNVKSTAKDTTAPAAKIHGLDTAINDAIFQYNISTVHTVFYVCYTKHDKNRLTQTERERERDKVGRN